MGVCRTTCVAIWSGWLALRWASFQAKARRSCASRRLPTSFSPPKREGGLWGSAVDGVRQAMLPTVTRMTTFTFSKSA